MRRRRISVRAQRRLVRDSIAIFMCEEFSDGKIGVLQTNWEVVSADDERFCQDINSNWELNIPEETAQNLMDELWRCGLRPSEGTGSAGSLKATQDHLGDMQKLSWKLLEMVEKKGGDDGHSS